MTGTSSDAAASGRAALRMLPGAAGRHGFDSILSFVLPALLALLAVLATPISRAVAQDATDAAAGIVNPGDAVVTGFSGTTDAPGGRIIDPDGPSVRVFDLTGKGPAQAQVVDAPVKFEVMARDIGQVFGVALDNAVPPNIYLTATAAYGLHIVAPGPDGNPVPVAGGRPDAAFMDGQWGPGGNAGTVWKIDGRTGKVSVFAVLKADGTDNGGAGLGNIVFDPSHYQLFVSDLDSGLIFRLDMNGNVLGTFDHGRNGRPAEGLDPVEDDGSKADITSPDFSTDNSDTWGLTDIRRRVWGLGFFRNRLYYAVGEGPQIWSVGFNDDGSFAGDAQVEIRQVPGGMPVTDILFTPRGRMILAQRGGMLGSTAFEQFHTPGMNSVLRYTRGADGKWVQEPEEYAIGFRPDHRNASGGVGLSCEGVLWSTGDALRDDPALAASGRTIVHGLQGNDVPLVRPRNVPPWAAWFVDYDGRFGDGASAGHVGDVEIARNCRGTETVGWAEEGAVIEDSWPGWTPPGPGWTPPPGWLPPPWWPRTPDLEIAKDDTQCTPDPAVPGTQLCTHTITVSNVGAATFTGFLNVVDTPPANAAFVPPAGGSIGWNCSQMGGPGTPVSCTSATVQTLPPGTGETLVLTLRIPGIPTGASVLNCARVDQPGDPLGNNTDCGDAYAPGPNLQMLKTLNFCTPAFGGSICTYWLDVTNTGTAAYTGWLHVADTLPAGSVYIGVVSSSDPAWACLAGAGTVDCYLWTPALPVWSTEWVEIAVFIPPGSPPGQRNCAALGMPEHAGDPNVNGDNADCAPVVSPAMGPIVPLMANVNLCPKGWSPQVKGWKPPKGWQKKVVTKNGRTIVCGRKGPPRKALYCPPGWTRYPSATSVPRGWQIRKVGTGSGAITCARPQKALPPPPPPPVTPGPECRPDEDVFVSPNRVPRGWKVRRVTRGGRTIWCAKPRKVRPPRCLPHEQKFLDPARIPADWRVRRVTRGGRSIWCAYPVARPCPPGTHRVGNVCRPDVVKCPPGTYLSGDVCIPYVKPCPRGMIRVDGRCVPKVIHCPPGTRRVGNVCKPFVKPCPRRMVRIDGRCVPKIRPCPPGMVRRHGECVPRVVHCPPGMRRVGNVCKPLVKPCPRGMVRRDGRCVPKVRPCPEGTRRVGNVCRPLVKPCPRGMIRRHGRCVPKVRPCPRGTKRVGNVCRPLVKPCPRGMVRRDGRCVPKVRPCPKGTKRVGRTCKPVAKPCPKGTIRKKGRCVPLKCPPGTHRVRNRCIPDQGHGGIIPHND